MWSFVENVCAPMTYSNCRKRAWLNRNQMFVYVQYEYIFIIVSFLYSFLCNPAKDVDLRKWAAEGLAYLTLDADVKEDLVEDTDSLRSIVDLSKVPNSSVIVLSYK